MRELKPNDAVRWEGGGAQIGVTIPSALQARLEYEKWSDEMISLAEAKLSKDELEAIALIAYERAEEDLKEQM